MRAISAVRAIPAERAVRARAARLSLAVPLAAVLLAGCAHDPPASAPRRPQPASSSAALAGLAVQVAAAPPRARTGTPVRVTVRARATRAHGALGYVVTYGDGSSSHDLVPQFCLGGARTTQRATWHFEHRYRARGTYRVRVSVHAVCTAGAVSAAVTVRAT